MYTVSTCRLLMFGGVCTVYVHVGLMCGGVYL